MAQREVVTKVSNAVLYSDGTIRIDNVRASYPHLDKAFAGKNDKGEDTAAKFGIVGMLPKKTHTAAKELIKKVIQDIMKENDTKVSTDKWFLRDGDNHEQETYDDHWIVSARESRRPSVRDRKGTPLSEKEVADTIYGGCYVNILLRPWYQDGVKVGKGYGKRINAGLVAVQFVRDGEAFGEGRIDDEGVFETVDDDDNGFNDDNEDGDDL